jgi:hypothetical protein
MSLEKALVLARIGSSSDGRTFTKDECKDLYNLLLAYQEQIHISSKPELMKELLDIKTEDVRKEILQRKGMI